MSTLRNEWCVYIYRERYRYRYVYIDMDRQLEAVEAQGTNGPKAYQGTKGTKAHQGTKGTQRGRFTYIDKQIDR